MRGRQAGHLPPESTTWSPGRFALRIVSTIVSGLALLVVGCSQGAERAPPPSGVIRLSPAAIAAPGADVTALIDRDTTTTLPLVAPLHLTFSFSPPIELRAVKSFAARSVILGVDGTRQTADAQARGRAIAVASPSL